MRPSNALIPRTRLALAGILMTVPLACGDAGSGGSTPPPETAPTITSQPAGKVLYETQSVTFSVTAAGTAPSYQWKKDGGAIAGATSASYTIASPTTSDAGTYSVEVTNVAGSATSSPAVLVVQPLPDRAVAMPLLSRGMRAFASSGVAANAVDSRGDTLWTSSVSSALTASSSAEWIALDVSSASRPQLASVILQWSNFYTWPYQANLKSWDTTTYNLIHAYTLDGHRAAGGGDPPAANDTAWTTLATVASNDYHSRQHALELTAYNWVRIHVTEADASFCLNLELHDATAPGANEDWLILGDSITAFAMGQRETESANDDLGPNFATLVTSGDASASITGNPSYTPVFENGGIGGMTAADAISMTSGTHDNIWTGSPIDRWLAATPARYITLNYGTNDVNAAGLTASDLDAIETSFETLIGKITAAGKIPVIPKMPWAPATNVVANGPLLNARIDEIYVNHPEVLHGPDLWSVLQNRNDLFTRTSNGSRDTLHPDPAGIKLMRQAWARVLLETVYRP